MGVAGARMLMPEVATRRFLQAAVMREYRRRVVVARIRMGEVIAAPMRYRMAAGFQTEGMVVVAMAEGIEQTNLNEP